MSTATEEKVAGISRYYIDTNVLMYATGGEHPLRQPCVSVLTAAAARRLNACTSAEVLQEILHCYTSRGERDRGVQLCLDAMMVLGLVHLGTEVAAAYLKLARTYPDLGSRDALHAAAVVAHGLAGIISADRDIDRVREVRRFDPSEFAS